MIFVCSKPIFKLESQTINCEIIFDENVNADVRVCWGLDMDVYVDDDGKEHIALSARYKPVVESFDSKFSKFSFSARKGSIVIVQAEMLLNNKLHFGKAYFIATNTNSTKHFLTLTNENFEKINIACTTTNLRRIDVNTFNKNTILNELANACYNIHYIKYDTALLYHLWIREKIHESS